MTEPVDTSPELPAEEAKHLSQALLEQSKGFATAVLLVSGSALSLSLTWFTKLGTTPGVELEGVPWLKAAWVLLGVAMLTQVFTVLTSMHAIRSTLTTGEYNTRWATVTDGLNWAIGALLVLGLAGLLVFAFMNVK